MVVPAIDQPAVILHDIRWAADLSRYIRHSDSDFTDYDPEVYVLCFVQR